MNIYGKIIVFIGIIALLIYCTVKFIKYKNGKKVNLLRELVNCTFYFYLIVVLYYTFGAVYTTSYEITFNFIPIKKSINMINTNLGNAIYQIVGNILMLVPFGFFISLLYKRARNILVVGCLGFLFSFLIEIIQALLGRVGDVDDLIFNTIGAMIGFIGYKIIFLILKKPFEKYFKVITSEREILKSLFPVALLGLFIVIPINLNNIYSYYRDNSIKVSAIPEIVQKDNYKIVAENKDENNYVEIMSEDNNGNLKISEYIDNGKKRILELVESIITDNISEIYTYRDDEGTFINYFTSSNYDSEIITNIRFYSRCKEGKIVKLESEKDIIEVKIEKPYMIKNIDVSDLKMKDTTKLKIKLEK